MSVTNFQTRVFFNGAVLLLQKFGKCVLEREREMYVSVCEREKEKEN